MNLKQLEYFVAVAEELHFGRAAERLNMAQPPLSRQIQSLENELQARLLHRERKAISLTQAGQRLYEHATSLLRQVADMKIEIGRIGQGAEGRLRIGFAGSAALGLLPVIVRDFRKSYPEVSLSLMPMNRAEQHRSLIRRDIDIAIARPSLTDPEIVTRKLVEEALMLAVPDGMDLPDGPADLATLTHEQLILCPEFPRPSFADFVLDACADMNVAFDRRVFTLDFQTTIALVAVWEGIAIVPAAMASVSRAGVRFHTIKGMKAKTGLSVNHRVDAQGIHIRNFVAIAQRAARDGA